MTACSLLSNGRRGCRSLGPSLGRPFAAFKQKPPLWIAHCGAFRGVITGFDVKDPDFIDPELPLFARPVNECWRYMDDPTLASSILERNNVGMGMLVMNRQQGFNLPMVNDLYKRLRNLEVNTLKRFVGLTSAAPGPFSEGIDPQELLLAVAAAKGGKLPSFSMALLWHQQELAHLVFNYWKPVVCQVSGIARNEGAALAFMASNSGVWQGSSMRFDACQSGLIPMGGSTFALAKVEQKCEGLGKLLAATGLPLEGQVAYAAGLTKSCISPDALPFLELTAEKHLEVTEELSGVLLKEHDIEGEKPLPGYLQRVANGFDGTDVKQLATAVRTSAGRVDEDLGKALMSSCPTALKLTVEAIKYSVKNLNKKGLTDEERLLKALRLELAMQKRLLGMPDVAKALHRRCTGSAPEPKSGEPRLSDAEVAELIQEVDEAPGGARLQDGDINFFVPERSEMSLSAHPRLRRYHPDYDPKTGMDHDPIWMKGEATRWDPGFLAEERAQAIAQMTGQKDPAEYGQARFVRGMEYKYRPDRRSRWRR
mmetsp:Transcript_42677/g.91542  ORF Transcript_42677/g.91542 Transcript_42677/m.91542 type:complete len:539 (+) Transcript_42677:73-1689(+)